ncbi:MAG: hypothetical protein RIB61_08005 [Roseicyclus sp.]|jgi:hypothetical protein
MKRIALIAAVAASMTAPAFADATFAINHFNQDFDSTGDIVKVPATDETTTVSTSGQSSLSVAYDILNASQDSVADLRGVTSATVILNTHSDTAERIFAELDAE